ncbi:DUF2206 domain-containing protein [Haloferax larsenii]|uniref:DUF2206 domain-containing protein n=1 Tax=Haloferax larsenii TaxID=302484 RepID=A0ABY5RH38_HALLR|nr:DUF2206 domain-containing protein [Haloferax larsenii]UVE50738.1 DUF2206 domain-containing protein [Haloferax larsenii]
MTHSLINWLRFEIGNLPTNRLVIFLTATLLFSTTVGREFLPASIQIVPILGSVLFLFVPGAFLIGSLGINLSSGRGVIYSVLVSQSMIMIWGAIASVAHIKTGAIAPFTSSGSSWWGAALITVTAISWYFSPRTDGRWSQFGFEWEIDTRVAIVATIVVLLGAISAHIVNEGGTQVIWFASVALVAICVSIACSGQLSGVNRGILIWASGATLLFQNTVVNTNLRYGDGLEEFYMANQMFLRGYWDPSFVVSRNSVLRLTVGHPFYSALLDLPLFWEFKLIHPLTLSILPVSLFVLFRRFVSDKTAALGACSYLVLHPFFTTMSRNTRSGITILFFVGIMLAVFDSNLSEKKQYALGVLFGASVVVSHYGLVYLLLVLIISGFVWVGIFKIITDRLNGESRDTALEDSTLVFVSLFMGVFAFIWFANTAGTASLEFIVLTVYQIAVRLSDLSSLSHGIASSAAISISSITYRVIKLEYFVLLGLGGCGYLLVLITDVSQLHPGTRFAQMTEGTPFESADNSIPTHFLGLAGGALFLFVLALTPTSVIGIARVLMIGLVFLLPFTALTVTAVSEYLPADLAKRGFTIGLVVICLLNSGVAATTLGELSTQPTFDKEDILSSGSDHEKFNLYQHYVPDSDVKATKWIYQHSKDPRVYGPGAIRAFPRPLLDVKDEAYRPQGDYKVVTPETLNNRDGYLFVSQASYELGEIVTTKRPNFVYYDESIPLAEVRETRRRKVYSNGYTTVLR